MFIIFLTFLDKSKQIRAHVAMKTEECTCVTRNLFISPGFEAPPKWLEDDEKTLTSTGRRHLIDFLKDEVVAKM
jgi:hypothetical protein